MTRREMEELGWEELDILFVSGDAYLDHPACGPALLGRLLAAHGLRVGLVAQPRWEDAADISALGRPRLFAGVSAGAMDSMLAHYTAFRKKRRDDAFTPGGVSGARPNRAGIIYTNLLRQAFPGLPVLLGGIEASLRRVSHYDFWSDSLRRSLLLDAKADLLVYGMGENALLELAGIARGLLASGEQLSGRTLSAAASDTGGLVRAVSLAEAADYKDKPGTIILPAHEDILAESRLLLRATLDLERQVHEGSAFALEPGASRCILLHPPARALSRAELDFLYGLPFTRKSHPGYAAPVPAEEMLRTSLTSHRGCGGGCAFCSLALHQGRGIAARSRESILSEAANLAHGRSPRRGKGLAVSDVGGPSGNMWASRCLAESSRCARKSCLFPALCPHFHTGQAENIELLRAVASLPGISQVRMASGVRYDLGLCEPEALRAYVREFTGGQLKIAPEHVSDPVLKLMRKPGSGTLEQFLRLFKDASLKEQYVVPYLMSAYPGCTDADMRELADWLRARGWRPQQVQCFIPTPGTVATAMFYCGEDPEGRAIHVARSDAERLRQHGMLTGDRGGPGGRGGKTPRGTAP